MLVLMLMGCDGGAPEGQDGGAGGAGGGPGGAGGGPPVDLTVPEEAPSPPVLGATEGIHIAVTGDDDAGDGSAAAPYRNIQHVLDEVAGPGDTLLLHDGTYEEAIRIRHTGLTLQSAPGERAHLACPVSIDENEPILCVEIDAETSGVTLRSLEISGGFYAVFLGSQWDYDDSPLDNLAANHVLIEDCTLHDTGRDVVKIPAGCDDVTIRRTEIFNSGMGYPPGTPPDEKNAEGIDAVNADRVHIADVYIHDTATSCAYVKGGSIGTVIERVTAERCGELGLVLGFDTSPEFFDTVVNPSYYENLGGVIRNSLVTDTRFAGIGLFATRGAHVLHNTIRRAGSDGMAGIYLGVATQDYDPAAGRPANVDPTIIGNIVDQTGLDSPSCFGIRFSVEDELGVLSGLDGSFTIDHNLYFSGGAPCLFSDARVEHESDDFAAWQALGFDPASLIADPMLDESGHLRAGSPAVDALPGGTAGVSLDLDGEPREGAFDLGADESPGND
ncbi:MAG: right-handed parallel beta-helix repeat-containing protein [bacterium]